MVQRVELQVELPDLAVGPSGPVPFQAVTLVFPDEAPEAPCTLALGFPGGGYSRRYWDIEWQDLADYSQAQFHASRGWIFAAVDHLGVGDSAQPEEGQLTLATAAATNAAVAREITRRARTGTLTDRLGPLDLRGVVGIAHSMGAGITVLAQAAEDVFDAVAILGFSAKRIVFPTPNGPVNADTFLDRGGDDGVGPAAAADLRAHMLWAFHMDDEDPALVDADTVGGFPSRGEPVPPWGSLTSVPAARSLTAPGAVAEEAALLDCPIFIGVGERDVVADARAEAASYPRSSDITVYVLRGAAHLHNFARTRARLWSRLHSWCDGLSLDEKSVCRPGLRT